MAEPPLPEVPAAPGEPEPNGTAPASAWNTWDAAWPACLAQLASGACVRIGAYSASEGTWTAFPWSPEHRLGTHLPAGELIEAEFSHAGTTLGFRARAAGESTTLVTLRTTGRGEWGLRFWLTVELGAWAPPWPAASPPAPAAPQDPRVPYLLPPAAGRAYLDPPAAVLPGAGGGLVAALVPAGRPTDARLAAGPGAIGRAMATSGYYTRPDAPPEGQARYAVFRFAMTEPSVTFAAAAAPTPAGALGRARRALTEAPPEVLPTSPRTGVTTTSPAGSAVPAGLTAAATPRPVAPAATPAAPIDAVRDVLGWNTVWDRRNQRAYTASTRAWIDPKFGGFGVWQIDGFLHAVLAAHLGEPWLAWVNTDAVLAGRTPEGNLTALVAGTTDWRDRSHPPFGAHAVWTTHAHTPDAARRDRAAGILLGAFDWWFRVRDGNRNGLLEYGSSPAGDGHFVHTRQAAMDEAANDNSPVYDEARFDPVTHTLDVEDVGLNSLLVHEGELLARLLREAGRAAEAERVAHQAAVTAQRVRAQLWDPARGVFASRHWDGRFTRSLAPTSFYPLLAGIATTGQAQAMVTGWLADPRRFGGVWPVAGTPHADPAAADDTYWRGRVWPCFNYAVYLGLRRYRFDGAASWLARRGAAMFARDWVTDRRSWENFSQRTGAGGGTPDSEPFYTWGALLPLLAAADLIGVDPWDGITFGQAVPEPGEPLWLDPDGTTGQQAGPRTAAVRLGGRWHEVTAGDGVTTLTRDGAALITATLAGRFRQLEADSRRLAVEVPAATAAGTVTATLDHPVTTVRLDGADLPAGRWERSGATAALARLDPAAHPRHLEFLAG